MAQSFISIEMLGDKQLQAALDALAKKDAKRLTTQSLRVGTKHLHKMVLQAVPRDTGLLYSLMSRLQQTVKAIKRTRRGFFGFRVETPRRADFPPNTPGITDKWYYPAILEYGSKKRGTRPHPYLRDTTDEQRLVVLNIVKAELKKRLEEFVAKRMKRK